MAGFSELAIGLQAPKLAAAGAKLPIVSGGYLKYSRFPETGFDRDCVAETEGTELPTPHPVIEPVSDNRVRNGIFRCRRI